jgi:hypothetical protein
LLVHYKASTDANATSSAFSGLINAIYIQIAPLLRIVVNRTIPYNQLLYAEKARTFVRIQFPDRQVLHEYIGSISKGLNQEVRLRLHAIISTIKGMPKNPKSKDAQSEQKQEIEQYKTEYEAKGVRKTMTGTVEDFVVLNNQERVRLIKYPLAIQQILHQSDQASRFQRGGSEQEQIRIPGQ